MLSAILLAAGVGKRLKFAVTKPLVKIGRQPVIIYSLKQLDKHPDIDEIIIVVNARNKADIIKSINLYSFKKIKCLFRSSTYTEVVSTSVSSSKLSTETEEFLLSFLI